MRTELLLTVGIIGFVLLILNAVFLGIIFFMRRKMAAVSQWPSTMGTVLMSNLEARHSSEGGWTNYPVVQYSYQAWQNIPFRYSVGIHMLNWSAVDMVAVAFPYYLLYWVAQGYQGSRIAPGPEVGGSGASKVVARYPAGAQVMVFYNPQNPSDAVLERKAPAQWLMWFILILFDCILCGVVPVLYFTLGQQ